MGWDVRVLVLVLVPQGQPYSCPLTQLQEGEQRRETGAAANDKNLAVKSDLVMLLAALYSSSPRVCRA